MLRRTVRLAMLGTLMSLTALTAQAGDILVESAPIADKEDAVRLHAQLTDALGESSVYAPRLLRRFHLGEGWRYLVVVEGLEEAAQAEKIAGLVDGFQVVMPITPKDGPINAPRISPTAAADGQATGNNALRPDNLPNAESILRAAIKAHGGREGGAVKLSAAQAVRFTYERRVPEREGTLLATNEFLRSGDAIRLNVTIRQGKGQDSVTTLTEARKGWVKVGERTLERDGARTLEVLERFAPESILAIPLGLPDDVETAAAWRGLKTKERRMVGEHEVWLLTGTVEPGGVGLREAAFDVEGRQLRWVSWAAEHGDVTFFYEDYRELDRDLVVPFSTRIEQEGNVIEEIRVAQLELEPELASGLFEPPGR